MPADVTCPSCRQPYQTPLGIWDDPVRCPRCGADVIAAPLAPSAPRALAPDPDDIVSWLAQAADPPGPRAFEDDPTCRSCGYTGPMDLDLYRRVCPACHAGFPTPFERVIPCPDCGLEVGVSEQDRDKTILCPRCKAFLGCLARSEGTRWIRRRRR